jgi:hypothetical protein
MQNILLRNSFENLKRGKRAVPPTPSPLERGINEENGS